METAMPLRGSALSQEIRQRMQEYILQNHLKAGDALPPESYWTETFGVGRSSVREAIKVLQALGVVEIRHGNGLYVRAVNFDPVLESLSYQMRFRPQMFAELFRIRVWLESAAIEEAVRDISDEVVAELAAILAEWRRRIQSGESHVELDEAFHRVLYTSLQNSTLLGLFRVFWIVFQTLDIDAIRTTDPELGVAEHELLFDAIRARDPELARRRLIEHFAHVQQRIDRAIQ
ncbi:MAG: FadR family transcriptional regulator [Caldilineaceae bacterium]|nr:FadR family transcriptional regulator [Caldilineaceae bacterium]